MGDPQAPFAKVKEVLARRGLLAGDRITGRLLSIGDHFDWGTVDDRADAAHDGEALLSWLASHDPNDVVILAGNHDLARVGELNDVDDARFAYLQRLADRHYHGVSKDDHSQERIDAEFAFFRACPTLPSTEIVARDLSTYRHSQHRLVRRLLIERRMRLAHAEGGLLFTHAGITRKALTRIGVDDATAASVDGADVIAASLNRALDEAVARHLVHSSTSPLVLPGLHRPADAIAEGDGVLYHRPTWVAKDQWLEPRRFDPRRLPAGVWQVVGHVRDKRCVSSLRPHKHAPPSAVGWTDVVEARPGVLRHLIAWNNTVMYRHGLPPPRNEVPRDAAVMIFIDGALSECPVESYELLDLRAL